MPPSTDPSEVFGRSPTNYDHVRMDYDPVFVKQVLEASLGPKAQEKRLEIMDVGAGTGKLGDVFLGLGHNVTFIEPNTNSVRYLKEKYPGDNRVRVVEARAESMPDISNGTADAVVMGDAAHWIDEQKCLPELKRILKSDGEMMLFARFFSQESSVTHKLHELLLQHCEEYRASPNQLVRDFSNRRKRHGRHLINEEENAWRGFSVVNTYSQDELVDFLKSLSSTANALEKDEPAFRRDVIKPLWEFATAEGLITADNKIRLPYEIQALYGAPRLRHLSNVGARGI